MLASSLQSIGINNIPTNFGNTSSDAVNQGIQTSFNGQLTQSQLPKTLLYCNTEHGNLFLYEVKHTTLLLVTPESFEIPGYKKSNEEFLTPDGVKNGIVFYKNRKDHITALDKMFGESWKTQLSEPLRELAPEKEPILMWNGLINNTITAYLYEYSDKCLAVFTPAMLEEKQGAKFWRNLKCPHSTTGKSDGWLFYKTPGPHHAYLKYLTNNFDYESLYKKSIPPVKANYASKNEAPINNETIPLLMFETNILDSNTGTSVCVQLFEYKEESLALFLNPHMLLNGLNPTSGLTHPTRGKIDGFCISKNYQPSINYIESTFGFSNIKDKYVMHKKSTSTHDPRLDHSQTQMANSLSNITSSINDIPLEVLVRNLIQRMEKMNQLESKTLLAGDNLYFGPKSEVDSVIEILDTFDKSIEITSGENKIVIMKKIDEY